MYIDNSETRGKINANYKVEDFQYVEARNGEKYFCAKIYYIIVDGFKIGESYMSIKSEGFLWISHEAGEVKEEYTTVYYVDNSPVSEIHVRLILKNIQKGK
jgi:hypothetical protein